MKTETENEKEEAEGEEIKPAPDPTRLRTFTIYFDGGCEPNPGHRYGSYEVWIDGERVRRNIRTDLGFGTNNEAEYMALELCLSELLAEIAGVPACVRIFSDSMLVVCQVSGKWRCKNPRMRAIRDSIVQKLDGFVAWKIEWRGRESNVRRFGH